MSSVKQLNLDGEIFDGWEEVSKSIEEDGEVPNILQIADWANLTSNNESNEENQQKNLGIVFNTLCDLTGCNPDEAAHMLSNGITFSTSIGRARAILAQVDKLGLEKIPNTPIFIEKKTVIYFELINLFHHIYLELVKRFTISSISPKNSNHNFLASSETALFFGNAATVKDRENLVSTRLKYTNFIYQLTKLLSKSFIEPKENAVAGINRTDQPNFLENTIKKELLLGYDRCWLLQYIVNPGETPRGLLIQKTTEGFNINFRIIDTSQDPPLSSNFTTVEELLSFIEGRWGSSVFFTKFQRFFSKEAGLWQTVSCTTHVLYTIAKYPLETFQALTAPPPKIEDPDFYRKCFLHAIYQSNPIKKILHEWEPEEYVAKILHTVLSPPENKIANRALFPLEEAVAPILDCFIAPPVNAPFNPSSDWSPRLTRAIAAVQEIFELRETSSFNAFTKSVVAEAKIGSAYALARLLLDGKNLESLAKEKKELKDQHPHYTKWMDEADLIYSLTNLLQITYEIYQNKLPVHSRWIPIWAKMNFAKALLKKAETSSFSRFSEVQQFAFSQIPDLIRELEEISLSNFPNATFIENVSWEKTEKELEGSAPSSWIIHLLACKEQKESVLLIRKDKFKIERSNLTSFKSTVITTPMTLKGQEAEINSGSFSRIETVLEEIPPEKRIREEIRFEFYDPTLFGFVSSGTSHEKTIDQKHILNFLKNGCGTDPKVVRLIRLSTKST